jgi:hypothetical protein
MWHNSKFDDADADADADADTDTDTDTHDVVVFFVPALIAASTSPLCPHCCGRCSLFFNRHVVALVVLD